MIIDCCTLFNELDMLEVRLHTLRPVVDLFVVVEATETFSGQPKPLFFNNFEDFPINYVVVDDLPVGTRWERERFQRNAISRGLPYLGFDDLIVISDVDEIPYPETYLQVKDEAAWQLTNYYYTVNQIIDVEQIGPTACRGRLFKGAQELRDRRFSLPRFTDQCWHFSYFGGAEQMRDKIHAFSHSEYDTEEYTNLDHLQEAVTNNVDLFKRNYSMRRAVTTLPPYLLEHRDRFSHWFNQ